jgi:hypothetical protein
MADSLTRNTLRSIVEAAKATVPDTLYGFIGDDGVLLHYGDKVKVYRTQQKPIRGYRRVIFKQGVKTAPTFMLLTTMYGDAWYPYGLGPQTGHHAMGRAAYQDIPAYDDQSFAYKKLSDLTDKFLDHDFNLIEYGLVEIQDEKSQPVAQVNDDGLWLLGLLNKKYKSWKDGKSVYLWGGDDPNALPAEFVRVAAPVLDGGRDFVLSLTPELQTKFRQSIERIAKNIQARSSPIISRHGNSTFTSHALDWVTGNVRPFDPNKNKKRKQLATKYGFTYAPAPQETSA